MDGTCLLLQTWNMTLQHNQEERFMIENAKRVLRMDKLIRHWRAWKMIVIEMNRARAEYLHRTDTMLRLQHEYAKHIL